MLINVEPVDSKAALYFEVDISESTEYATKLALQLTNSMNFFLYSKHLFTELAYHGLMRAEAARGLKEPQDGEYLGPDMDNEQFRCGFRPSERGQQLLAEVAEKIGLLERYHELRSAVCLGDFDNLAEFVKGSLIIAYPEGLGSDPLQALMDYYGDYQRGEFTEDGFYNIETGAVFFCNKPLVYKGENLKCLKCSNSSTIKVIPSKSATYAPRNSEDYMRADMMRYAFERQKKLKYAELNTEEDAYGEGWTDSSGLKKYMLGMGEVKFK